MAQNSQDSGRKLRHVSTEIDRISNLPEPIICHILSFLPTRDAVKTILLSPKFSNLWKNITTLSFSYHADYKPVKFVDFVNSVFLLLETRCMEKLSLDLSALHSSKRLDGGDTLSSWVVAAVAKNVRNFSLSMNPVPWFRLPLPRCVLTCNTLETLELSNVIVELCRSSRVHLPNLRVLRIEDSDGISDYIGVIVSGCPSLHTLYLGWIKEVVGFSSHAMPCYGYSYSDSDCYSDSDSDNDNDNDMGIDIDAPALKYLCIKQTKLKYLSIETSSQLIEADISLGAANCESRSFDDLIQAISNVKVLVLDVWDDWLEDGANSRLLPMFSNLTSLTLCNFSGEFNVVKELFHKSPALETLCLKCIISSRSSGFFCEPNLVPRYLKMVKVEDFYGSMEQLKLLRYVLLNASLLKTMKIMTHRDCESKLELLQAISWFRRKSKYCRIKFDC